MSKKKSNNFNLIMEENCKVFYYYGIKIPSNLRRLILNRDGIGQRTNIKIINILKIYEDETKSKEYFGPRYFKVLYNYKNRKG